MPQRQGDTIVATAGAARACVTGGHRRDELAFGPAGCAVPLLALCRYLFT